MGLRVRVSAAISLLFHLLVVGLAPLTDARLEAASAEHAPAHVEDQRAPACRPSHNHLHCPVCRVLQALDLPVGRSPLLLASDPFRRTPSPARTVAPAPAAMLPFGPRAPPSV